MTTGNENSPLTPNASGQENGAAIEARALFSADNGMPCQNLSQGNGPAPEQASHAADERAAFVKLIGYDRPETEGVAVDVWDSQRTTWLEALAFARAASANETGAEGTTVGAWVAEDDRAITAAQKQRALDEGGATASAVRPYSIPCYLGIPPAMAAEAVAYVCSASNDFAPIVRDKGAAQRLSDAHGDGKIVPLYAAPQPAQAEVRVRLTDDLLQRCRELLELNEKGESPQVALRVLADTYHPDIAAHDRRSMAVSQTHIEALRALLAHPGQTEPRAEVTDAMLKAAALAYDAFPCPPGESVGRGQHLGQLRATLQAAIDAANTGASS